MPSKKSLRSTEVFKGSVLSVETLESGVTKRFYEREDGSYLTTVEVPLELLSSAQGALKQELEVEFELTLESWKREQVLKSSMNAAREKALSIWVDHPSTPDYQVAKRAKVSTRVVKEIRKQLQVEGLLSPDISLGNKAKEILAALRACIPEEPPLDSEPSLTKPTSVEVCVIAKQVGCADSYVRKVYKELLTDKERTQIRIFSRGSRYVPRTRKPKPAPPPPITTTPETTPLVRAVEWWGAIKG